MCRRRWDQNACGPATGTRSPRPRARGWRSGAARSTTATGGAWLGVDLGNALGPAGALVEFVVPGSPADRGGIELGDVITAIDGRAVGNPHAASSAIAELRPGATALFTIDRFGQPIALRATLGSRASAAP